MQTYDGFEPTVHIVDDNEIIRDSLQALLTSVGMRVITYATAYEFLNSYSDDQPGCMILDLRLPGMDGLELQQEMAMRHIELPVIFLTAHGDLPVAVQAMKQGAIDFLSKPVREQLLLDSIKCALARNAELRSRRTRHSRAESRLAKLTPREREVLQLLLDGKSNKMIAADLGLSHKTIEFHRSRIMAKSQSDSLADLVRMSMLATDFEPVLV